MQTPGTRDTWFQFYIAFRVYAEFYAYIWDIGVDFGLYTYFGWDAFLIKDKRVFPRWAYIYVMIEDLIARHFFLLLTGIYGYDWDIVEYPRDDRSMMSLFRVPLLIAMLVEMHRRHYWAVLRIENAVAGDYEGTRQVHKLNLASAAVTR